MVIDTAFAALIISLVLCVLNVVTFAIARKKDNKEDVTANLLKFDGINQALLKANMKLDQVCATTSETRSDIKSMGTQVADLDKRIARIEENEKTMWRRLDELREDLNTVKYPQ